MSSIKEKKKTGAAENKIERSRGFQINLIACSSAGNLV
jgi:hypothetical protein